MALSCVPFPPCFCGEAPVWISENNRYYWVDTGNPVCYTAIQDTPDPGVRATETLPAREPFQTLGVRKKGGFIGTLPDRVVLTDEELNITESLGSPVEGIPAMGLNDGTCGPDGCFYFGVNHNEDLYSKAGGVFRVTPQLTIEQVLENLALPNGMCFSPDGSRFYVTEMFGRRIWRHAFSRESGPSPEGEVFIDIPEEKGLPDGLICDAEGYLLSAHWQGFRITRYTPEGAVDTEIEIPVPTPTCMALGGPDMHTLLITTARKGLTDEQLELYPDSGKTYLLPTVYTGKAEYRFEG